MDIKIRPAQLNDAEGIWKIRNEPASLAVAASPETILLDRHIAWFKGKYFTGKDNHCFVGEMESEVVSYCRFDLEDDKYLISVAVASSMHGRGIATFLLGQSIKQLNTKKSIHAEIRRHNIASAKIFERNGFKKISEDKENFYYQLKD